MRVTNIGKYQELDSHQLVIAGLGYEPRCTYVTEVLASKLAAPCIAIGYSYGRQPSYVEARKRFANLGAQVVDDVSEEQFSDVVRDLLNQHQSIEQIAVDISSLNRHRLAVLVYLLHEQARSRSLRINYLYSPAHFVPPAADMIQNESVGPVTPRFSGVLSFPETPPEVIVGLGYENGKAIGAVEYLQSHRTWLLIPTSKEQRFENEVLKANHLLLNQIPPERVLQYNLEDPAGLYTDLCSLISGLPDSSNPILLPLGPKLFALTSLLVGLTFPKASVWRASQGKYEVPVLRQATGEIIGAAIESG